MPGTLRLMTSTPGQRRTAGPLVHRDRWNSSLNKYVLTFVKDQVLTQIPFFQLVKTSKPTGDADCPPHVLRAHYIDDLMNEKAGSRDLDDEDIVDAGEIVEISDDDGDDNPPPKKSSKPLDKKVVVKMEKENGSVARRATSDRIQQQPRGSTRNGNQDILTNISNALDPHARQARSEEVGMAAMQATQVFQLSSQLRETQRQLEGLRGQLMEAERCCNAAEHRADWAELVGMLPPTSSGLQHPFSSTPRPKGRQWRSPILQPWELHDEHPHPRFCQEIHYCDGGSSTHWVGGSDDEGNGDDLTQDSPGTCQYTFYNDDNYLPPPASQRQTSPQARRG